MAHLDEQARAALLACDLATAEGRAQAVAILTDAICTASDPGALLAEAACVLGADPDATLADTDVAHGLAKVRLYRDAWRRRN